LRFFGSVLRAVPQVVEVKVVKEDDGVEGVGEVHAAAAVVAPDTPGLQAGHRRARSTGKP
jgi:hypothetical protein